MKLNNNDDSHNSGLNLLIYNMLLDIESHPAWVCGLKQELNHIRQKALESHPAWVCGLKHTRQTKQRALCVSHPAWVCGLKHQFRNVLWFGIVTPCVGVWIETYNG